jgi:hypothetical protein
VPTVSEQFKFSFEQYFESGFILVFKKIHDKGFNGNTVQRNTTRHISVAGSCPGSLREEENERKVAQKTDSAR